MSATYTKLRSGNWGLRSTTPLRPGDVAVVVKRSGQARRCVVGRVLWQGEDGKCIATIATTSAPRIVERKRRDGSVGRVLAQYTDSNDEDCGPWPRVEPEPDYAPANDDAPRFADEWEGVGS